MGKRKQHHRERCSVTSYGAIVDSHGGVIYDCDAVADLTPQARQRIAELLTEDFSLEWEGSTEKNRRGVWDILIEEGLILDNR